MDKMKYVHAVRELNFHDNLMAHPGRTDIKVPILDVMVAESQRIPGLTNTLVQVPGQVFRLAALEVAMDTNEEGLVSVNYAWFGRKLGIAQPGKPEAAVQAVRFVIRPLLAAKLLSKVQTVPIRLLPKTSRVHPFPRVEVGVGRGTSVSGDP